MNSNERLSNIRGLLGNLPSASAVQECHQMLAEWPDDDVAGFTIATTLVNTAMAQYACGAVTALQAIGTWFPEAVPTSLLELHYRTASPNPEQVRTHLHQIRRAVDASLEGNGPGLLATNADFELRSYVLLPRVMGPIVEDEPEEQPLTNPAGMV